MTSVFNYNRWQPPQSGTMAVGSVEYLFFGLAFYLTDLNSTDMTVFTNMFQFYCMKTVTLRVRLRSSPDASYLNSTTSTGMNFYQDIFACVDHNDAATPLSNEMFFQQGKKVKVSVLRPNTWFYYMFHLTVQQLVYSGVVSGNAIRSQTLNLVLYHIMVLSCL